MNVLTTIGNDCKQMWTRAKEINCSCKSFGTVTKDFFQVCGERIKNAFTKALGALKVAYEFLKDIWVGKIAPEYRHIKLWHIGLLATALIPIIAIPCILGPEAIPVGIVVGALPVLAAVILWWRNRNYNLDQDLTNNLDTTLDDLNNLLEPETDKVKIDVKNESHINWERVLELTPALNEFAKTNWKENIADLEEMVKGLRQKKDDDFEKEHKLTVKFAKSLKNRLRVLNKVTDECKKEYETTIQVKVIKDGKETKEDKVVKKPTEMVEKSHGIFGT